MRALRGKTQISYHDNLYAVAYKLIRETKPGDAILLKAVADRPIFPVIDLAFGTSLFNYSQFTTRKIVRDEVWTANYCVEVDGSNILRAKDVTEDITIPDFIGGKPVFRIGKGIFKEKSEIKNINFGNAVLNIGAEAFCGCNNIEGSVNIPSVIHIEQGAFKGCCCIEEFHLPNVEHIENDAFKDCSNCKKIYLSEKCATIEDNAFSGIEYLTIVAPKGSYAWEYAKKQNILTETY